MNIIADLHCHTLSSGHAYSTIMENIREASELGLYAIAITDHSEIPPYKHYFHNLRTIPREVLGVKVLRGIEANILNKNGDLDLPDEEAKFDWVIASLHDDILKFPMSVEECTNAWLNVARNPSVNVIGHSGRYDFIYDYDKVIPEFGKNGKLVEINNSSFGWFGNKKLKKSCRQIALACKKYGVQVVVSTDAHFCKQIGRFENSIELLKDIDFPEELIVNAKVERFENYLRKYSKFFE